MLKNGVVGRVSAAMAPGCAARGETRSKRHERAWTRPAMTNFLLGLVAGGLIACIATISAARHPDIQARLGLIPPAHAALAAPPNSKEADCKPIAKAEPSQATAAQAESLFSRRRFWYVAP